jgi:hypothetical protein|tara:strand:+ start:124 stop:525 length:402 start_codon:yes stop_codon:yes gene_type:complete
MNKNELKKLIKPVVKECIHEVLLEEGLLSNIVSEVAKGMDTGRIVESQAPQTSAPSISKKTKDTRNKLKEHRRRMSEAAGQTAYNGVNLFEGTTPIDTNQAQPGSTDLGDPRDAGVDISSLVGPGAQIWQNMK